MTSTLNLDTSGFVGPLPGPRSTDGQHVIMRAWSDLDAFTQGYVGAALTGDVSLPDGAAIPRTPLGFSDLAPATLSAMMGDCSSFANIATGLGAKNLGLQEGRNFWSGRNGRAYASSAINVAFPPIVLYLGEDGLIYQRVAS